MCLGLSGRISFKLGKPLVLSGLESYEHLQNIKNMSRTKYTRHA